MMKKLGCVLLLAAFMGCTTTASAGNPLDGLFGLHVPDTADCVGKWCPDDYCPKPEPCADSKLRFLCDDYCPNQRPAFARNSALHLITSDASVCPKSASLPDVKI